MYVQRLKSRHHNWCTVIRHHVCSVRASARGYSRSICNSGGLAYRQHASSDNVRNFGLSRHFLGDSSSQDCYLGVCGTYNNEWLYRPARFYSSERDERGASEDKHAPVETTTNNDKAKAHHEKVRAHSRCCDEHPSLGHQEQQERVDNAKSSHDCRKMESPFLTKKERFKNEFMRRLIPWEKITVSWETFPYYLSEETKCLLVECATLHLRRFKFASSFGARLPASSGRILLQGITGSELYHERLVRALARELQVPLLVLDSAALAPYNFGEECASDDETDDENVESGEECPQSEHDSDSSNVDVTTSSSVANSDGIDEDDVHVKASRKALKNIIPFSLEEFAQRVSGEGGCTSTSADSDISSPPQELKGPLRKGDRVKYVGATVHLKADNRLLLNGQRGEVCAINGDQVAVILDKLEYKSEETGKHVQTSGEDARPSIYWIHIQDIVRVQDNDPEGWYIAMEALHEVLQSLQPVIVYFPDSSEWLSRAVPYPHRKEFISKLEGMFDHSSGPIVLIGGQTRVEKGEQKGKEKFRVVLPSLNQIGQQPFSLKQLTEGLKVSKASKNNDIYKVFTNIVCIHPPKEEGLLRTFYEQLAGDKTIVMSRNNLIELSKVLDEHDLSCMELLSVATDGVVLTKQKAEKVVGWARNHYLSSCNIPFIKADILYIPLESMEVAMSRLRMEETTSKKPLQTLKSLAKDEYESNFVSSVVPPEEIGVKFDDIGALENVKKTLNELVILPMRRPELFSHGNLLRPCKGILLFGPPGTGKTLLAKALATEAGASFINITGSTLTSKWFGDAEKLTKALFSFASKLAPVIIFVDEVDSLLGARGGAFEHEATRRMRNEFMAAWDGLRSKDSQRILILGATNRPFDLDDAVIRRLPRRIYVDLPDAENRLKILKIFLSQENIDSNFDLVELANVTEGYSGSDLKNLCIAAAYRPVQELLEQEKRGGRKQTVSSLRPIKLEDFTQAKSKVGASVAYDAVSMHELRKWNEQYGEGGSRRGTPFGFGAIR